MLTWTRKKLPERNDVTTTALVRPTRTKELYYACSYRSDEEHDAGLSVWNVVAHLPRACRERTIPHSNQIEEWSTFMMLACNLSSLDETHVLYDFINLASKGNEGQS